MAEQFREDPTKKPGVEAGEQKTPEPPMSPEAATRKRLFDQKSIANRSLDRLFAAYNGKPAEQMTSQDVEDPLVSSASLGVWSEQIGKALTERKGSRNQENVDIVTPLALLLEKACRRNDPSAALDKDSERLRDDARKTVEVLFGRYPDKLDPNALKSGKFDRLLEMTGKELEKAGLQSGTSDSLVNIGKGVGKENPIQLIRRLDDTIESLANKLATDAYDDVTENAGRVDIQTSHRSEGAKILPRVNELMRIRAAMSQHLLGREISSDDVLKIVSIKDGLENATVHEGVTADTSARREKQASASESSPERKETREILNEILRDAPALIYASFRKENFREGSAQREQVRSSGLQEIKEPRFGVSSENGANQYLNNGKSDLLFGKDSVGRSAAEAIFSKEGVNEVVMLAPVTEKVFEERKRTVEKKGLFGLFKQNEEVTERVEVGERHVMHAERVKGGKQEPLVELMYRTYDEPRNDTYKGFQDYSGRTGQLFSITLRLPEKLARKCLEQIKNDPAFLRKMVEQAATAQNGISAETWRDGKDNWGISMPGGKREHGPPLRPPYEQWLAQHPDKGARAYIHSELDRPNDQKFHPENLLPVR